MPERTVAVTMADVAARAGVSRALVSIVFRGVPGASPENRERVMRAAAELDYRLDHRARLLGSKRSRTIGVVFGLHSEFHSELVEQLYAAVEGSTYELALGATAPSRNEDRAVRTLIEQRCEAVVLLGPSMGVRAIAELADRLPVVVVARSLGSGARGKGIDVVRTDDVAGGRLAVEHLAAHGHRDLAHVDGGRAPGSAERRKGFKQASRSLGLPGSARIIEGGLVERDGERAAEQLISAGSVTAVAAFNDHVAVGLMAVLRSRGRRVPEDVSVVGYDDSRVAALASVDLTTIAQDAQVLARHALELAVLRTEEPGRPQVEIVVPPALVERGTVVSI